MRVQLCGEVADNSWGEVLEYFGIPCFYPAMVRNAVDACPAGEDLVLEINSVGGSVFAGFEIYSVLRAADRRVVAEVQSIAASAASVLMLGCDEVAASPVAQVMIHLPTADTDGDRYDHLATARTLDSVTDSILNAYVIRSNGKASRAELRGLMRTSTWLTAPEARDLGLVDRILGEESLDPELVLNSCAGGHGIRSLGAGRRPDRKELRERYQAAVDLGKAPELPQLGIFKDPRVAAMAPDGDRPDSVPAEAPEKEDDTMDLALAALELEKTRFGGAV